MKITETCMDTGYGSRTVDVPEGRIHQECWGNSVTYLVESLPNVPIMKAEFKVKEWTPKGLEWAKLNRIV